MIRQAATRSQRNKALRAKDVIQICLLVSVFFWLLYQMKHSYDKKKTLVEHNTRIASDEVDNQLDLMDLGRKGLPHNEVIVLGDKVHNKEEDNEQVEEEEDREIQQAMDDEEAEGTGDDGIDKQDHEEGEEQDDQEKGDEEGADGEGSVNDEDKDDQVEEADFLEDQENKEGSSQESHEKIYKTDDASSAVLQENQVTGTEDKNDSVEEELLQNNEKDIETNDTIGGNDDDPQVNYNASVTVVVATGNETIQNNSLIINRAAVEKTGQDLSPVDNQTKLQSNSSTSNVSANQVKLHTNSPVMVTSNGTEGKTNTMPENGTLSVSVIKDPKKVQSHWEVPKKITPT